MKNKPIETLSRRGWLKSGAVFLGAFLMGCQKPAKEIAVDVTVKPLEHDGYRMYGIETKDGQGLSSELISKLGVQPDYVHFQQFSRRFRRPLESSSSPDAAPVFQYVLWALPKQIESLGAIDGITVVEKLPEHVFEVGDQVMGGGIIAVKCLPNTANGNWQGRPCATLEQIVARWQNQFKGDGITVTVVSKEASPEKTFGEVMDPEQIIIRFDSPEVKRKILEHVKEHPQSLMLQWGKPFTHLYCPGCGMG